MKQSTKPLLVATPHKAIRYAFAQLSQKAGNLDYTNKAQVSTLKAQLKEFTELLDEHAHLENEFVLKALEKRLPGSSHHDADDHLHLDELQKNLLTMLDALLDPAIPADETNHQGYAFYQDLSSLHAAHLEHMLEEERVTHALMMQHFTDAELFHLHQEIIDQIPPQKMLAWMKYLLPAISHAERVEMLKGMQAGAPAAFFGQVMSAAERSMPAPDFGKLSRALGLEAKVNTSLTAFVY